MKPSKIGTKYFTDCTLGSPRVSYIHKTHINVTPSKLSMSHVINEINVFKKACQISLLFFVVSSRKKIAC